MAFTKVAPAGIGSTPGDGYRIGDSFLHSTGVEITNINATGILTAASLDISGAIDFDGHTELDNVNISGVSTFAGNIDANGDLDVDGHTNLDNVSVSGVSTFSGIVAAGVGSTAVSLANGKMLTFGSEHELEMFHDGSQSYIKQRWHAYPSALNIISENSQINIMSGSGGNAHGGYENAIRCINNGAVELYWSGAKYFETKGDGVQVYGNIYYDDALIHRNDTDTKIRFPAADTFTVETAGTERFRIDSSGRLLLGTTTEGGVEADDLTISTSTNTAGITIRTNNVGTGRLWFSDATSGTAEYAGYVQYDHNTNKLVFGTNSTSRVHIDSSGHFMPNADSSYNIGSSSVRFANIYVDTLYGSGANLTSLPVPTTITVADESSDTTCYPLFATTTTGNLAPKTGTNLVFNSASGNLRSGSLFVGTATNESKTQDGLILERNSGDGECHITAGRSGGNYGGMQFYVAGASGVTKRFQIDYQSIFRFYAGDGTTERLRIASDGKIGVGDFSSLTARAQVHIHQPDSNGSFLRFTNSTSGTGASDGAEIGLDADEGLSIYNYENDYIRFGTNGTERVRITNGGALIMQNGGTVELQSHMVRVGNRTTAQINAGVSTATGSLTLDTSVNNLKVYVNNQWAIVKKQGNDGSTQSLAARSAKALLDDGITSNGVYWLDMHGAYSSGNAKLHYCLMDTSYDGGGWTMLYSMNHGNNFASGSNYSFSLNVGSPTSISDFTAGNWGYDRRSTFLPAANDQFLIRRSDNNDWKRFVVSVWSPTANSVSNGWETLKKTDGSNTGHPYWALGQMYDSSGNSVSGHTHFNGCAKGGNCNSGGGDGSGFGNYSQWLDAVGNSAFGGGYNSQSNGGSPLYWGQNNALSQGGSLYVQMFYRKAGVQ